MEVLKKDARLLLAKSEAAFWKALDGERPDLILLDVRFGGSDGMEILRRARQRADTGDVPVIMMTSPNDLAEIESLESGAADFFSKPLKANLLRSRVLAHCARSVKLLEERQAREDLLRENRQQSLEIGAIKEATIMALVNIACVRDNETGNHLLRTQAYVKLIANRMVEKGSAELTSAQIEMMSRCAPLHDVGKVGIPDRILLKPGPLDAEEFEVMKTHAKLGHDALSSVVETAQSSDFLMTAMEIAGAHHEKWDGSGYPQGLAGARIPLSARIMACADVYDALISERPYKKAFSHQKALEIIEQGKGRHFDPDVVEAFMDIAERVKEVASELADKA